MIPSPPRLAERLVRATAAADAEWADSIAGDLQEEFAGVAATAGEARARRWYWRQALGIAAHRVAAGRTRAPRLQVPEAGQSSGRWHVDLVHDVRSAWRAVAQQPAVTLTIVLVLALGLAANATMFALGDALVLRPFRFPDVDRAVVVASAADGDAFFARSSVTPGDFAEWQDRTGDVFDQLAGILWWDANLAGGELPEQVPGFEVTPSFFAIEGVRPAAGRLLTASDALPGAPRVVVLSHGLWTRRFGSDPSVVSRTVLVDGEPSTVVGVAGRGFTAPYGAEVWAPLVLDRDARQDHTFGNLIVVGRLRPGVSLAVARGRMQAVVAEQRRLHPTTNSTRQITVRTYTEGFGDAGAPAFIAIWQVAAMLLLLVAGANVVNLLLARGVERQREFAIRLALGAGRARIVYQLMVEGALLTAAAAAVALALAWAAVEATRAAFPPLVIRFVPGWDHLHVQPLTILATAGLAGLVTIVASLVPGLRAARSAVVEDLRQGTRLTAGAGRQRLRGLLAGTQIALTVALLTAAALTVEAVGRATHGPLGFVPDRVLTARIVLPEARYDSPARIDGFLRDVQARLEALPSVNAAAALNVIPYSGSNLSTAFWREGIETTDATARQVDLRHVTPAWSSALQVPLVRGRALSGGDRADAPPVAVVSESLARELFSGREAIGQRFRLERGGPLVTVVGVVGDVAGYWILRRQAPTVYRPMAQAPTREIALMLRVAGDPAELGASVRAAVAAVDPQQPVSGIRTYPQVIADSTFGLRFAAQALGVMAAVALLVSLVGVYSLMAYLASRRTREMGVRAALGASSAHIARLTVGQAGRIAIAGAAGGLVLAEVVGRLLESALFGVVSASHGVAAGVAVAFALAAIAASYPPARKAANVDPVVALRAE